MKTPIPILVLFFLVIFLFGSLELNADHYFYHENTWKDTKWWTWLILAVIIFAAIGAFSEWWQYESSDLARSLIIWSPYFILAIFATIGIHDEYGGFESFVTFMLFVIVFILFKIFGRIKKRDDY